MSAELHEKCFFFWQMTRELDKLFEKLGEQSKKATTEPAEVIA